MRHKVLILGSLGESQSWYRWQEKRDMRRWCVWLSDGPARKYADRSYVIPVTEIDRIATLCREEQVDGIITSFSDLLLECMVENCGQGRTALLSETRAAALVQG